LLAVVAALASGRAGAAEPALSVHAATGEVAGLVRRAGDRAPIKGATVLVVPAADDAKLGAAAPPPEGDAPAWVQRAETDDDGRFVVSELPGARARVVILASGYRRVDRIVAVSPAPAKRQVFFAMPEDTGAFRTVVRSRRSGSTTAVARRELRREEIETVPGAQGDPLRAAQNLPGFLRAPGGLGALVIRGGAPAQSQVFYGEHPIPRAFHLYALASSLPNAAIDRIDYTPGNFTSRRGDASIGILELQPRAPNRDGIHGSGDVSVTGYGASVEGPLGEGVFLAAARMGFLDLITAVAGTISPSVGSAGYYDYQAAVEQPLPRGFSITARALGSGDRWKSSPLDAREDDDPPGFRSDFHRFDLVARWRRGATRALVSPAFRLDFLRYVLPYYEASYTRYDYNALLRVELEHQLTRDASFLIGIDGRWDPHRIQDDGYGEVVGTSGRASDEARYFAYEGSTGLYVEPRLRRGPLTVMPGARFNVFAAGSRRLFAVDPRLRVLLELTPGWELRAGVGLYSRASYGSGVGLMSDTGVDLGALVGNAEVQVPVSISSLFGQTINIDHDPASLQIDRMLQVSAGAAIELNDAWTLELTGYWMRAAPTERSSLGNHRVGGELWLRRHLVGGLYGWLSYSLMALFNEDKIAAFPGSYDQRHNLNLALSYALPRGWRIGGRLRVSSGLPYTPIVGAVKFSWFPQPYDLPVYGRTNSARYPWFHQLDLRVDREWILKRARISAYLDILNVYNANNIELYAYSRDYRQRVGVAGLPIIPAIGLHVDY
ncbi:MAG: TonB-dependent receptor, partial [Myxococcales bacterium]|nr:TonB-dependent receptor [Myxococcales bacterium]